MKLPLSPNGGSLVYIFWPTLYKVCICHTGKAVYLKKWPLCYTVSNLVATSACIMIMSVENNMLNDDEFFSDCTDTPDEGMKQDRKLECLKVAINKGKVLGEKK